MMLIKGKHSLERTWKRELEEDVSFPSYSHTYRVHRVHTREGVRGRHSLPTFLPCFLTSLLPYRELTHLYFLVSFPFKCLHANLAPLIFKTLSIKSVNTGKVIAPYQKQAVKKTKPYRQMVKSENRGIMGRPKKHEKSRGCNLWVPLVATEKRDSLLLFCVQV